MPIGSALDRLRDPDVIARLAAELPPVDARRLAGSAANGLDTDLNAALAPLRWRGLNAAEAVGAAYQIDATPAIWAMKVDDPTWEAALETIEVAMKVCVLD